ncbi:hypothetical protein C8F04DRAFT_328803 [Mycena alexandri]|uniref:Uncharacterized protein n=1 Tax=Mycena alexandri TaxID=1745969 RepID=A0AAD6S2H6_9AGAR|nr:hypothetical protein C8F04DRAFT_328803 [Mycena alexandri]
MTSGQSGGYLTCIYPEAGQCTYFADGNFSIGTSLCPSVLSSATNQSHLSGSSTICPATDATGGKLIDSGVSGKFKTCTYGDAGICTYFSDGFFSSGTSSCPDTIMPSSCVCSNSTAEASAASSLQGDTVLAASDPGPSVDQGTSLNPTALALFALNVVLLAIILVLATMLIRARRGAALSSYHQTLYTSVDGQRPEFVSPPSSPRYYNTDKDSASMPLTHGALYSDPHE